jgi:hypothetical protein
VSIIHPTASFGAVSLIFPIPNDSGGPRGANSGSSGYRKTRKSLISSGFSDTYPSTPFLRVRVVDQPVVQRGWLVVDDIQIPSVYELFHFLKRESSVALEEVAVRTAFFPPDQSG